MPSWPAIPDARRIRSYFTRLPLATRLLLALITGFYIANLIWPTIVTWGALTPKEINLSTLHRLTTYPLIHPTLPHYLLNLFTLTPLLERFESTFGTLTTLALFTGPFASLPALLYTATSLFILRSNTPVVGASVFTFLLLAAEAIKTHQSTSPAFQIGTVKIPTWTGPLAAILLVAILVPGTSLLGHLCGAALGYAWGLGYARFLAPPEWALRWIEGKMDLLGRLPHYVSVDQKVYGRYGVLPTTNGAGAAPVMPGAEGVEIGPVGSTQRLGP